MWRDRAEIDTETPAEVPAHRSTEAKEVGAVHAPCLLPCELCRSSVPGSQACTWPSRSGGSRRKQQRTPPPRHIAHHQWLLLRIASTTAPSSGGLSTDARTGNPAGRFEAWFVRLEELPGTRAGAVPRRRRTACAGSQTWPTADAECRKMRKRYVGHVGLWKVAMLEQLCSSSVGTSKRKAAPANR